MTHRVDASFAQATRASVEHYLDRMEHLLRRVASEPAPASLLATRVTADMHDTGWQFAVAIRFAGRALCPLAGSEAPDIPDRFTCEGLIAFIGAMREAISAVPATVPTSNVRHEAGDALLDLPPADHALRFGLPNMLFHLTMAYAGLRMSGMAIGKADFDGLHRYG